MTAATTKGEPASEAPPRTDEALIPRRRRRFYILLAFGMALVGTLILSELVSLLLYRPLTGYSFSYARAYEHRVRWAADLESALAVLQDPGGDGDEQKTTYYKFHPYLGYVGEPGLDPWGDLFPYFYEGIDPEKPRPKTRFNEWGFLDVQGYDYPYEKSPGDFVVAVLGGSVAEGFANVGAPYMQQRLEETWPEFRGRRLVVLNFGLSGYKQPQQVLVLLYALMADFEIDAVVNLDGFNELALARDNIHDGIHPLFPSALHVGWIAADLGIGLEPDVIVGLAEIYRLLDEQREVLRLIGKRSLNWSVTANLVAHLRFQNLRDEISRKTSTLTHRLAVSLEPEFRGPDPKVADDEFVTLTHIWRRGSEMLQRIADENGLVYVHILQPNQYYERGKKLTPEEEARSIRPDHPWGKTVREGYDYLVREGRHMKAAGMPFYDWTMIFEDEGRAVYYDDCCHFIERGYAILARRFADILREETMMQLGGLPADGGQAAAAD